jgi:hypothetical protein
MIYISLSRLYVPDTITPVIRAFLFDISLSAAPAYIKARPEPWALPTHCFDNVKEMVARQGGSMRSGWAISDGPLINF